MNDNLLVHLHRWAHQQDENFTTEAFAHLLRYLANAQPEAALALLHRLLGEDVALDSESIGQLSVQTQQIEPDGSTPDIRITGPDLLAFVEVKVDALLAHGQDQWYLKALGAAPNSATDRRLVVLTRFPVEVSPECRRVRWYEIGDELELLLEDEQPEPAHHLIQQFLEFLDHRRLVRPRLQSPISVGLRSYEKNTGGSLIFQKKIQSLDRLLEDDDLRGLLELLQLVEWAIEESGLFPEGSKLGSGQHDGGWIGWNIGNMKYFVYVYWAQPEILRFQTSKASIELENVGGEPASVIAHRGLRFDSDLDLASQSPDFFSRSKRQQLELLVKFLRDSCQGAAELA